VLGGKGSLPIRRDNAPQRPMPLLHRSCGAVTRADNNATLHLVNRPGSLATGFCGRQVEHRARALIGTFRILDDHTAGRARQRITPRSKVVAFEGILQD